MKSKLINSEKNLNSKQAVLESESFAKKIDEIKNYEGKSLNSSVIALTKV